MAYHFNQRIKIIERKRIPPMPNDYEDVVIARPYADVRTLKGRDFISAGGLSGVKGFIRFIIRYREGINHYHKVEYKNNIYDITSIENDDGKNRTITIFCEGVKNWPHRTNVE